MPMTLRQTPAPHHSRDHTLSLGRLPPLLSRLLCARPPVLSFPDSGAKARGSLELSQTEGLKEAPTVPGRGLSAWKCPSDSESP